MNISFLTDGLEKLNIEFDDEMIKKTEVFYDMLVEKNKVMNLTSITDEKDFISKHILDSLLCSKFVSFSDKKIIDVGTGAGFPGLPLKIFFPEIKIVLIDSVNKKLGFINEVIDKLELKDISTVHGRAEDLARNKEFREKFDLGVSRAVANLSTLSELCIPFIRNEGKFIFYKAKDTDEEISASKNAFEKIGDCSLEVLEAEIPGTDICRRFVVAKKNRPVLNKYPRKAGEPNRNPL